MTYNNSLKVIEHSTFRKEIVTGTVSKVMTGSFKMDMFQEGSGIHRIYRKQMVFYSKMLLDKHVKIKEK